MASEAGLYATLISCIGMGTGMGQGNKIDTKK